MFITKSWMKAILFSLFMVTALLVLSGCNEEHPDNLPGAVNNPYPEISIAEASTVTIDAADDSMVYSIPVRFSNAAPESGQFTFRFVSGTAIEGRDYAPVTGAVAFSQGDRQANIEITLLNDKTRSQARDFRIDLTTATHATLGADIDHKVTITAASGGNPEKNDETAEPILLTLPAALEFVAPTSGQENYSVVLPLSARLKAAASVQVGSVSGTARAGVHYQEITGPNCEAGSCTLAAGAAELVFLLPIIGYTVDETRSFQLQFVTAEGMTLPGNRVIDVNLIYSNEVTSDYPQVSFPRAFTLHEPTGADKDYNLHLTLSETLSEAAELSLHFVENTAQQGVDFEPVKEILPVREGSNTIVVPMRLKENKAMTSDVSFQVQLLHPRNIVLPAQRHFDVHIAEATAAAPKPQLTLSPNLIKVPAVRGTKSETITLYFPLTDVVGTGATVNVQSRNGSAGAGVEFVEVTGVKPLATNATQLDVNITLLPQAIGPEPREFELIFSQANGIQLPESRVVTVQIDGRDTPDLPAITGPSPGIIPVVFIAPETNGDSKLRKLALPFSGVAPLAGKVKVFAEDGTAREGKEFTVVATTLNFDIGVQEVIVELNLEPSTVAKTFRIILESGENVLLPEAYEQRVIDITIEPYS